MDEKRQIELLKYIDSNILEKMNLMALANFMGYSPFYFSKIFSQTFGISVTNYVRIRKLQHSMTSLLKGEKIIDVAFKYGFETHEGYTRSFTKLFGSTPMIARKHLSEYKVPDIFISPTVYDIKNMDKKNKQAIADDMHQIAFSFINESIKEAKAGYCSQIYITFLPNNHLKIVDNGRGISLKNSNEQNYLILSKIFASQPITKLEYDKTVDFSSIELQTISSVCEKLSVKVNKNYESFKQDYIKGIAQHEIQTNIEPEKRTGMEISLIPDKKLFDGMVFSKNAIQAYIEKIGDLKNLEVYFE